MKIRTVWTCSDHAHHEHKTWIGAYLCGCIQFLVSKITGVKTGVVLRNQNGRMFNPYDLNDVAEIEKWLKLKEGKR